MTVRFALSLIALLLVASSGCATGRAEDALDAPVRKAIADMQDEAPGVRRRGIVAADGVYTAIAMGVYFRELAKDAKGDTKKLEEDVGRIFRPHAKELVDLALRSDDPEVRKAALTGAQMAREASQPLVLAAL